MRRGLAAAPASHQAQPAVRAAQVAAQHHLLAVAAEVEAAFHPRQLRGAAVEVAVELLPGHLQPAAAGEVSEVRPRQTPHDQGAAAAAAAALRQCDRASCDWAPAAEHGQSEPELERGAKAPGVGAVGPETRALHSSAAAVAARSACWGLRAAQRAVAAASTEALRSATHPPEAEAHCAVSAGFE